MLQEGKIVCAQPIVVQDCDTTFGVVDSLAQNSFKLILLEPFFIESYCII